MEEILRLKKIYKDFKITCFTIPFPKEFFTPENQKHFKVDKYKEWAKIINSYDWLEIGVHGFAHTIYEMDCGYDKAIMTLDAVENLFEEIGLEYSKLFVAPFWQYSYDALVALKDRGYTVGIDRNHPRPLPLGSQSFMYNWSYEIEHLPSNKSVVGHGHTTSRGVKNGLENCYLNMLRLIPPDAEFGFISDFVKEEKEQIHGYKKSKKSGKKDNKRKRRSTGNQG